VSTMAFATGLPFAFVLGLFVVCGAGLALFGVWWDTALAERMPPHLLSRVSAYDWMGSLALLPFGYLIAGPLGEALGAREVILGGAVMSAVVLAAGLLVRETWRLERVQNSAVPSSGVDAWA
jgi:MFS family permease